MNKSNPPPKETGGARSKPSSSSTSQVRGIQHSFEEYDGVVGLVLTLKEGVLEVLGPQLQAGKVIRLPHHPALQTGSLLRIRVALINGPEATFTGVVASRKKKSVGIKIQPSPGDDEGWSKLAAWTLRDVAPDPTEVEEVRRTAWEPQYTAEPIPAPRLEPPPELPADADDIGSERTAPIAEKNPGTGSDKRDDDDNRSQAFRLNMTNDKPNTQSAENEQPKTLMATRLDRLTDFVQRVIRGLVLIGWFIALMLMAIVAWSGEAAYVFSEAAERTLLKEHDHESKQQTPDPEKTPGEILNDYLANYEIVEHAHPPPIEDILNTWYKDPSWTNSQEFFDQYLDEWDSKLEGMSDAEVKALKLKLQKDYLTLFRLVSTRLDTAAQSPDGSLDREEFQSNTIPITLRFQYLGRINEDDGTEELDVYADQELEFTDAARLWVQKRQGEIKAEDLRTKLANTFLLVIVLGAFGSMVFLIREYVEQGKEPLTTSATLFRPLLGMFLAAAMFVLDVLVHAIVSTADPTEAIRTEPLYVLAFAAGLLSETAYELVHYRAEQALKKAKEEAGVDEEEADKVLCLTPRRRVGSSEDVSG